MVLSSPILLLSVLALVVLANAAPVLAHLVLGPRLDRPVDGSRRFVDGRPMLGPSKRVRGIVVAVLLCAPVAELIGVGWHLGLLIAVAGMAGDLLSSFVKRRLGRPPHTRAPLLDELPEVLLPVGAVAVPLGLSWLDGIAIVLGFALIHALLGPIAARLGG